MLRGILRLTNRSGFHRKQFRLYSSTCTSVHKCAAHVCCLQEAAPSVCSPSTAVPADLSSLTAPPPAPHQEGRGASFFKRKMNYCCIRGGRKHTQHPFTFGSLLRGLVSLRGKTKDHPWLHHAGCLASQVSLFRRNCLLMGILKKVKEAALREFSFLSLDSYQTLQRPPVHFNGQRAIQTVGPLKGLWRFYGPGHFVKSG